MHDSKIHLQYQIIYFPLASCSKIVQHKNNQQILPLTHF